MFSLIKKLQDLFEKIKGNKGLFFTSLSVVSITGIFLFMYLILTMTGSVKEEVYSSIESNYVTKLNSLFNSKRDNYTALANTILADQRIIDALASNNKAYLNTQVTLFNELYKTNPYQSSFIEFFSVLESAETVSQTIASILRSKSQVFGLEIQQDGVFITLVKPVFSKGQFIGLIEVKQSVHSLKNNFEMTNDNFVFLLDKKMQIRLSLKAKSGKYKEVIANYSVLQNAYTSRFYSKITDSGEEHFKETSKVGHGADDIYYRSYKEAADINGATIGLYVIGQKVEENNGFVNIADNMVKSVTYVSLGLVISILLFMF
jgi:hypothetical protein